MHYRIFFTAPRAGRYRNAAALRLRRNQATFQLLSRLLTLYRRCDLNPMPLTQSAGRIILTRPWAGNRKQNNGVRKPRMRDLCALRQIGRS